MKLTYIFHSGSVLETGRSILIFDFWMDPAHVMESVLLSKKPLYVFSSHFHEDHFTREIFEWKKQKSNITYIRPHDRFYTLIIYIRTSKLKPKPAKMECNCFSFY